MEQHTCGNIKLVRFENSFKYFYNNQLFSIYQKHQNHKIMKQLPFPSTQIYESCNKW